MDELLWLRVPAAFLVDGSLAVLCGLLLSSRWLRSAGKRSEVSTSLKYVRLTGFALLLSLALCVQLLLLAISFSGQTSLHAVMGSMADVCSTHAGAVSLVLCGLSAALCFSTRIPTIDARTRMCGLLVLSCLCLHAFLGHASSNGNLFLSELLQVVHLLGMAAWSGGVIVSGLFVVPRLCREPSSETVWQAKNSLPTQPEAVAAYFGRLSVVSTWAVGAVVLSGLVKGYLATEGSLQIVLSSQWGRILIVKAAFVALTVLLGAKNRWLLASAAHWNASSARSAARTLRLEAIFMLAVLLLSAWLANSPPPLE